MANGLIKNASKYLSDDFVEFCSSGNVVKYDEIIEHYKNCEPKNCILSDFEVSVLSKEIVQAKYIGIFNGKKTLRSSLWRLEDGKWKMFFHQGTTTEQSLF